MSPRKPPKIDLLDDMVVAYERYRRKGFLFLLGAGASADCGIPTSFQLLEGLQKAKFPAKEQRELLDKIMKIRRPNNIEELFSAVHTLANPEEDDLFSFAKTWRIELKAQEFQTLALALEKTIYRYLIPQLRVRKNNSYLQNLNHYCSCARRPKAHKHYLSVFTLNYDLSVEQALERWPYWTGFDKYAGERQVWLDWNSDGFREFGVRLYKLHGSVNWGVSKHTRASKTALDELSAVPVKWYRANQRVYPKRRDYAFVPDDIFREMRWYLEPWGRFSGMIFGGNNKLAAYAPFPFLHNALIECLEKPAIIVVIGYGWADQYLNALLERQYTRQHHAPRLLVDVSRDAISAVYDKNRHADLFVGGGAKNALECKSVQIAMSGPKGIVCRDVQGGLIGAIKASPDLAVECGRIDVVDHQSFQEEIEKLITEAYSK